MNKKTELRNIFLKHMRNAQKELKSARDILEQSGVPKDFIAGLKSLDADLFNPYEQVAIEVFGDPAELKGDQKLKI